VLGALKKVRDMDIFRKVRLSAAEQRLKEEMLYQTALREIESGIRRDGLWAKAMADSKGVDSLAKSLYLKYRVQSMLDEDLVLSEVHKPNNNNAVKTAEEGEPDIDTEDEMQDEAKVEVIEGEWVCRKCGERHGFQFEACWKCESTRSI